MATTTGTTGNDVMTGTTADDIIDGGFGNDRINGGAGNDVLIGGDGTDTLTGDAGNDTLYGGNGNDGFFGGGNDDTIYGEAGDDNMFGDAGNDTFYGGDGNDTMTGGTGDDTFYGGAGVNSIIGGGGVDTFVIELSSATLTQAMRDNLLLLKNWMEDKLASAGSITNQAALTTGSTLTLSALGLSINTIENVKIFLDGVEKPIDFFLNSAPQTDATAALTTDEDTAISGQVVATDAEGDSLAYAVATGPAHGTLALDASTGQYVYTPGANFNGADSFQVVVSDPAGESTTQTVTFGVTPVNDAPSANATAAVTTDEDTAISGQVVALDIDGDTLGYAVSQGPANGVVTVNASTGEYTYTPGANFNGADSFQVVVADPTGATAIQTVTVGITPVNDAPVADAAAALTTNEDSAISGKVVASDFDGDTLGYAVAQGPANGALTLNAATGEYTYTPGANFNGADSFQVVVADPSGTTTTQTVTIGVTPVNDGPVADAAASLATTEDKAVSGQVIASDLDGDTLTWSVTSEPAHGTVALDSATGQYTYTPPANFSGDATFDVTVSDPSGATSVQRVSVSVSPVADTPTLAVVSPVIITSGMILTGLKTSDSLVGSAGADVLNGSGGNDSIDASGSARISVALDISSALTDLDGSESLSIRVSNLPEGGTLSAGTQNTDGSWSLTSADLAGLKLNADVTQSFTVHVESVATESNGATATAHADINVVMSPDSNTVFGGTGNDVIRGGIGNDTIYGNSGNDIIFGNGGDDTIYGGSGSDTLSGGAGNNVLFGNSGDDTFIADGGNDTINGNSGFDTLSFVNASSGMSVDISKKSATGMGTDTFSGIEKFLGSAFNDTFKGSSSADTIDAGAGNDWLRGLGGSDTLTGGAGSDTFFWEKTDIGASLGVDRITDFSAGDVLDFKKLVSLGTKPLADLVKVTDGAAGSTVAVKVGTAFVNVAVLDDVHGKTAADLFHDGQLLVG